MSKPGPIGTVSHNYRMDNLFDYYISDTDTCESEDDDNNNNDNGIGLDNNEGDIIIIIIMDVIFTAIR